jgi:hypothetical protein
MTREKYDERINWFRGLNMGGISDWAVDLDEEHDVGNGPGTGGGGGGGGSGGGITVIGGTTDVRDGTTRITGGITINLPGISTVVIGGSTEIYDVTTHVVGGVTSTIFPNPITTSFGGSTVTISGTRTVIDATR